MKQIPYILLTICLGCRLSTESDSPIIRVPVIQGEVLSTAGLPLKNVMVGVKLPAVHDSVLFPGGTPTSDSLLWAAAVIGFGTTDGNGLFSIPYSDSGQTVSLFAYRKGFAPWSSLVEQDSLTSCVIRLEDLRFNTGNTPARYRFTAIVDKPDNRNLFSLSLGSTIIGEFWYSPGPDQGWGWYPQDSLSGGLILPLGPHTFHASTTPPTQFAIRVYDNSGLYGTSPRDLVEFLVQDPQLADTLSLDDIQMIFTFHDHTATLIDSNVLPTELNLKWFETANIFFNGMTDSVAHLNWQLRLAVTHLERVP